MNGRQARRHRARERDRLERALYEARHAPPEYLGVLATGDEVWTVGRIMCVIPGLRDDYPPALKHALDRRRRATLTGRCDCGAERRLTTRARIVVEHAHGCPASDASLAAHHGLAPARWT